MSVNASFRASDFGRALETLLRHEVDFVLCGGVACILHGVSRVTADIDIAASMETENLERLLRAAAELRMNPRIPEPAESLLDPERRQAWIETKGARVFTLLDPQGPLQLDVFLEYPIPFDQLKASARVVALGEHELRVSSKEDLITAKRNVQPMRKVDLRDIEDLTELIEREREEQ